MRRFLGPLAALLALGAPAIAEPQPVKPKPPAAAPGTAPAPLGTALAEKAEQHAIEQEKFFNKLGERSKRAMRAVCAGCDTRPKAAPARRPPGSEPELYSPDTAGGVGDE